MAILLISLLMIAVVFVFSYNSLTFRKNAVDQSYGAIQAYMKKRADLIPNLVAIVRAYADHEKELLTKIVEVRSSLAEENLSEPRRLEGSDQLSGLVKNLFVRSESYPELKSNENFKQLQFEISRVEEQLSAARRSYSSAITYYNNGIEMIPYNFVAMVMGLKVRDVYIVPQADRM
jgi:LemA protein